MPIIIAKSPSNAIPKVDKRAIESIIYKIDCTELLDSNEIITSINPISPTDNILLSDIRSRNGTMLEIRVSNATELTAPYIDFKIECTFNTNFKNTKSAVFIIRVYKWSH